MTYFTLMTFRTHQMRTRTQLRDAKHNDCAHLFAVKVLGNVASSLTSCKCLNQKPQNAQKIHENVKPLDSLTVRTFTKL